MTRMRRGVSKGDSEHHRKVGVAVEHRVKPASPGAGNLPEASHFTIDLQSAADGAVMKMPWSDGAWSVNLKAAN
ncbi:MAG: hypothetical protein ACYS0H_11575 [Planctomycetota bacterium]|jgi:hypothetical protein